MLHFDEIPKPPTFCEASQNLATEVMAMVEQGEVDLIKVLYSVYSGDKDKVILKKALANYSQDKPLTPSEFGLSIYNDCVE